MNQLSQKPSPLGSGLNIENAISKFFANIFKFLQNLATIFSSLLGGTAKKIIGSKDLLSSTGSLLSSLSSLASSEIFVYLDKIFGVLKKNVTTLFNESRTEVLSSKMSKILNTSLTSINDAMKNGKITPKIALDLSNSISVQMVEAVSSYQQDKKNTAPLLSLEKNLHLLIKNLDGV